MTTVFGDPNYSMSSLFSSEGSNSLIKDANVDKMINDASKEDKNKAKETYKN